MTFNWDRDLPNLELDDVRIHAGSLTEAWQQMSKAYLVRSVLVTSGRTLEEMPFEYASAKCTVRDLYNAFAARYGLAWVQDWHTGVAWFHQTELAYDSILAARVQVNRDHLGLPLQSGILESLGANSAMGIRVKQWGSAFRNTFDFAVDVPAGEYMVRDILNLCCVANPTKTFLARVEGGCVYLTAVNIVPDKMLSIPMGALYLWNVEVRQEYGEGAPTSQQLMENLAHQKAEVRYAARNYLEAIIWNAPVDEWVSRSGTTEQVLWTCLGVTSVLVRSEEVTHRASIESMIQWASDDFLAVCEPELAVMTALELARLTKDARALEFVIKRNFETNELRGVFSDMCRIAALSGFVRKALRDKRAADLVGFSMPLTAMIRSPSAGKLEFDLFGS